MSHTRIGERYELQPIYGKSYLLPEDIQTLIKLFDTNPDAIEDGLVVDGLGKEQLTKVDEMRRSDVIWLEEKHLGKENYQKISRNIIENLNVINDKMYGVDLMGIEQLQLTRYREENQGHYDWHDDTVQLLGTNVIRKVSFIISLSDPNEYEGGDFHINDSAVPREWFAKGNIIVFPSWTRHKVAPVTKGVRHSLVGFVYGARWR